MKNATTHRAFTLVELLVVISIIGVLIGLTLPAVQSARAAARQTACLNNIKQIVTATKNHEATIGYLPYYKFHYVGAINTSNSHPINWVIPLLPYLGEAALWNSWEKGNEQYDVLPYLICPDTPEKKNTKAGLSYCANCGCTEQEVDSNGVYAYQLGAFVADPYPKKNARSSSAKMRDGATFTILFSENLTVSTWSALGDRTTTGILWASTQTTNYFPSSYHPQKGFNTAFADGSIKYLAKNLNYLTYSQLMAPDDKKASKYNSSLTNVMDMSLFNQ